MKKRIKFCLVYRDMWQSSGKYQPRVDQLTEIAPVIVKMGCFDRVETNGGAFEQVNLLYGENPNHAVREWTKPLREAGIQCQMLERALNGLRMYPVPADVRRLMCKVKKAQGVDVVRSFCGLNDHRNLELSIKYANEFGLISQAALSISHSPVHTLEHYLSVVDKYVEYGAKEIGLKDMAGIGRPATLGKLVKAIKEKYPHLVIQYHGHTGPGLSMASVLEVCRNGADIVDVAMEPLSWGMVHPDVIAVQAMLRDDGFEVADIDMNAYMEARSLTQKFIDDFLGYFIEPKNKISTSLLLGCGLPGGMMGSMMADMKGIHSYLNRTLEKDGKPTLTEDELLVKLFKEVETVWPMVGTPGLVTPFSQYVKNIALMNVRAEVEGKPRFTYMEQKQWDMILGKCGQLPGPLAPEIIEMAKEKGFTFFDGVPQDNYPDELPKYRKMMEEKGWDVGQDEEELFELAMHEQQYVEYKEGRAKQNFNRELAAAKEKAENGGKVTAPIKPAYDPQQDAAIRMKNDPTLRPVTAPASGQLIWEVAVDGETSKSKPIGTPFKKDEVMCHISAYYGMEPVPSFFDGQLVEVVVSHGQKVNRGDIIAFLK